MSSISILNAPTAFLQEEGIDAPVIHYQLTASELTQDALQKQEGVLNDTGALCINTGEFTGRSPKDKFIVKDGITAETVNWNDFNQPMEESLFLQLRSDVISYLNQRTELWVRDSYACATPAFRLNLRVITETASANLFAYNMFLRPAEDDLEFFSATVADISCPRLPCKP